VNAADQAQSLAFAHILASTGRVVRNYFPGASINLSPWRDDPETRYWREDETLDLAFHFPGWSPRLECRSLLIQLKVDQNDKSSLPRLIGIVMRGMTFDGERWRLATIGTWEATGTHLPQPSAMNKLKAICRDLFDLFP
tara:strand:+ start:220 stop:636 length:417 start_codon:yes stop_codon:yes gene_type:complete